MDYKLEFNFLLQYFSNVYAQTDLDTMDKFAQLKGYIDSIRDRMLYEDRIDKGMQEAKERRVGP